MAANSTFIKLENCHVKGDARINPIESAPSLQAESSRIDSNLNLTSYHFSAFASVNIDYSVIGRNAFCSNVRILKEGISAYGTKIINNFSIERASIVGGMSCYSIDVGNNFAVFGTVIRKGDFDLNFSKIKGVLAAYRTLNAYQNESNLAEDIREEPGLYLEGSLGLHGATISSVEFRAAKIFGDVEIRYSTFKKLILGIGSVPVSSKEGRQSDFTISVSKDKDYRREYVIKPCEMRSLDITHVSVEGSIDISGIQVRLPVDMREAIGTREERKNIGVNISQCEIGGDLDFFEDDPISRLQYRLKDSKYSIHWKKPLIRASQLHSQIWGHLELQNNNIKGALDLRNITVEGIIDISGSEIGKHLNISCSSKIRQSNTPDSPALWELETTCKQLNANSLRCEESVDFSGLRVEYVPFGHIGSGFLTMRSSRVRDSVRMLKTPSSENGRHSTVLKSGTVGPLAERDRSIFRQLVQAGLGYRHYYVIKNKKRSDEFVGIWNSWPLIFRYGRFRKSLKDKSIYKKEVPNNLPQDWSKFPIVDFTDLQASELVITNDNAPHPDSKWTLEGSKLRRLIIHSPPVGPINLSRLSADQWQFGDNSRTKVDDYINVLDNLSPFDRSAYLSIEQSLRNDGKEKDANHVYRAMVWESFKRDAPLMLHFILPLLEWMHKLTKPLIFLCSLVNRFIARSLRLIWLVIGGAGTWSHALMYFLLVAVVFLSLFMNQPGAIIASSHGIARYQENATELSERSVCRLSELGVIDRSQEEDLKEVNLILPSIAESNWTTVDSVWVTLGYGVPIVEFWTADWEASELRFGVFPESGVIRNVAEFISPSLAQSKIKVNTAAMLTKIFGFVAWPIFLIGIATRVFRGKRS